MDINSNDEYLKAFPPNFGPKLESQKTLDQLSDLQVHRLPSKNQQIMDIVDATPMKQMPNFICLDEDLECNEIQAPIRIHEDNAKNKTNEMLEDSEEFILCKEDFGSTKDTSNLTQPKINEPMSQMESMTLEIEVQRENELVLGEEYGENSKENLFSLQAIETRTFSVEALSNSQVDGSPSATKNMQEKTKHYGILDEEIYITNANKDLTLTLDNIIASKVGKSILEEEANKGAIRKEMFGLPTSKEFVESTKNYYEEKNSITNIDVVEDIIESTEMDTEALEYTQHTQPTIKLNGTKSIIGTSDTLGQIEFVEKPLNIVIETSNNVDVVG